MSLDDSKIPMAIVTGAAHRLGKVFAMTLARNGYGIFLHYHSSLDKSRVAVSDIEQLGVPVFPICADLTSEAEIRGMFETIDGLQKDQSRQLGPLKVLVNSAGIMPHGDAREMSLDDFDLAMKLNLRSPFFCSQLAFNRMVASGLIVNISDVAAQKAWKGYPAYSISKAGLEALTKVLARAFAPTVRVNAIAPGLVLPSEGFDPVRWQTLVKRTPAGRAAKPEELEKSLEFLLKNEYITGQTILVDGGYSLI